MKRGDKTAERATHLFFLVEALSVTVGYAETFRVEHVADFETAQDALHLPPTRPLATRQTHAGDATVTHSSLHHHNAIIASSWLTSECPINSPFKLILSQTKR